MKGEKAKDIKRGDRIRGLTVEDVTADADGVVTVTYEGLAPADVFGGAEQVRVER